MNLNYHNYYEVTLFEVNFEWIIFMILYNLFSDLRRLNQFAKKSLNTGMIIVGGGLIKHHICNANLMVSFC